MRDVREHVHKQGKRELLRTGNKEEFDRMVQDFVEDYGARYWGDEERRHLKEPDRTVGLLWSRDIANDNTT